mmetsp:Transcript_21482/g.66657  ORF Transcript_21482/g.66657 Transcript_21482/m.66657 type:complete len:234 (-) Transcript_21482:217-918(-)
MHFLAIDVFPEPRVVPGIIPPVVVQPRQQVLQHRHGGVTALLPILSATPVLVKRSLEVLDDVRSAWSQSVQEQNVKSFRLLPRHVPAIINDDVVRRPLLQLRQIRVAGLIAGHKMIEQPLLLLSRKMSGLVEQRSLVLVLQRMIAQIGQELLVQRHGPGCAVGSDADFQELHGSTSLSAGVFEKPQVLFVESFICMKAVRYAEFVARQRNGTLCCQHSRPTQPVWHAARIFGA